ncbi:hypothetical protein BGZ98_005650 [Dissophora globulifera]|nr:hypothetical protein BGZ98_005650 [Dissophora globulifera]
MQSPASSIQSPRPQGRPPAQPQVPFDKELMASLHVLLNQLNEVERQGLVMFHQIEESFKHPYAQQEAIADTANLLTQLDTLSNQAKTTGFGALTMLPTSPTVVSTPSASSIAVGTPKPSFMSPRMQNHIHNNLHNHANSINTNNSNNSNNPVDTQMLSPAPLSIVSTPAASAPTSAGPGSAAASAATVVSSSSGGPGSSTPTPSATGPGSAVVTPAATTSGNSTSNNAASSPFPSSDIIMSSTPTASGTSLDSATMAGPGSSTAAAAAAGTGAATAAETAALASVAANPTTPGRPSTNMTGNPPAVALTQMMDARQKDVNSLYTEKRRLKTFLSIAAKMSKP